MTLVLQVCVVLFKTLNPKPWTLICWLISSPYWDSEVHECFEETLYTQESDVIPNHQPGWMGVGRDQTN